MTARSSGFLVTPRRWVRYFRGTSFRVPACGFLGGGGESRDQPGSQGIRDQQGAATNPGSDSAKLRKCNKPEDAG
jgi:hypothetical protein